MPFCFHISRICSAALFCIVGMGALFASPIEAQTPVPQDKPVPPSASHPEIGKPQTMKTPAALKSPATKAPALYPTSAEETADAILADSLERLSEKTDAHFHEGEYNHAINLNRIIMQGDPHNVEAFGNVAYLLWSTSRSDQAVEVLKQGIEANPDTYYMYDEMGNHYWLHLKDPTAALPYYEKAVTFKCPWATWHSLALCYEKTSQWDKAVSAWENAARFPDDKVAPGRLERARQERDKHKADTDKSNSDKTSSDKSNSGKTDNKQER